MTTVRICTRDTFNERNRAFENIRHYGYAGLKNADALLSAVPITKVLISGTTWRGDLGPHVDATIAALEPLTTPFTVGRSPDSLQLGRLWTGNLLRRVSEAHDAGGKVDITGVAQALDKLRAGDLDGDSLRTLKAARDSVESEVAKAERNKDDLPNALATLRARDKAKIEELQQSNDALWSGRTSQHRPMAFVSQPAGVRDALHRARTATTGPDQLAALNAANRAFWAGRR